jgi:hypothetical protein
MSVSGLPFELFVAGFVYTFLASDLDDTVAFRRFIDLRRLRVLVSSGIVTAALDL